MKVVLIADLLQVPYNARKDSPGRTFFSSKISSICLAILRLMANVTGAVAYSSKGLSPTYKRCKVHCACMQCVAMQKRLLIKIFFSFWFFLLLVILKLSIFVVSFWSHAPIDQLLTVPGFWFVWFFIFQKKYSFIGVLTWSLWCHKLQGHHSHPQQVHTSKYVSLTYRLQHILD